MGMWCGVQMSRCESQTFCDTYFPYIVAVNRQHRVSVGCEQSMGHTAVTVLWPALHIARPYGKSSVTPVDGPHGHIRLPRT